MWSVQLGTAISVTLLNSAPFTPFRTEELMRKQLYNIRSNRY